MIAEKATKYEDALACIEYGCIHRQGCILDKLKESEGFMKTKGIGIIKSTITFKINLYQLIKKYTT